MDKYKYFTLVLYPNEDSSHKNILDYIISNYKYRAIYHDKDEGKEHLHIVFLTPSPRTLPSLKKELSIDYIEFVRTPKKMLEYLTHENDSKKYHYSYNETFGDLEILTETEKEDNSIITILDFIYNFNGYLSLIKLNKFVVERGLWAFYRRSSYIFVKTLEEHNQICYNQDKEVKDNENTN